MYQKNNFSFDDLNHIYRLNGQVIPSVTQILQAEGIADYSYADESDRDFGKAGHRVTELWDKRTLDIKTISEPLIPYLNGYKKFLKDFKVKVIPEWIETPTYSFIWKYGVKPDRVVEINGKLTVYEIKFSTSMIPATRIQTAAQKIAIEEQTKLKIKQRMAVQILPDDYKISEYTKLSDERIWLSAVILNQFKKENGLWKP
jgi:hypothetical protein